MNIAGAAVSRWKFTVFTAVIVLLGGLLSFGSLGQLEDPEFTVKTAVVMTLYPGASAEEVELEVTDRIEVALQEMPQLKELTSFSRAGMSLISADIRPSISSDELPQVWDELRKKVRDVTVDLPPGAGTPDVSDDFGDVFGFLLAIVGDGFSAREIESYADSIKKELSLVDGVARVELWGVQQQVVYLDVAQALLSQLGLTFADVQNTLAQQNLVVDPGGIDVQATRMRIQVTGEFKSPEDIEQLTIRGYRADGGEQAGEIIRIRDFASVRRGYLDPPTTLMRYDGQPAVALSCSNASGRNAVNVGAALDARIHELTALLPIGLEMRKVSWQSELVAASISGFMVSLAQAIGIVLVVLALSMGLRTSLVVGLCGLLFVIIASFLVMKLLAIDLQRMSLGALIIAMGIMVDNAIVVADGALVRLQAGMGRVKAAVEAAAGPSMPLLGATVIGCITFYPIAASDENAGEYCASLFSVVTIALLISWVLSVTVTPLMCIALLPQPKTGAQSDPYAGAFYRGFRKLLQGAMRYREFVIVGMLAMLVSAVVGFGMVGKLFFPASARAQFMIDYWAPEGTRIQKTSSDLELLEQALLGQPGITAVSTFVGKGPPRFYLPVDPESPYAAYGQLVVNTEDFAAVNRLLEELPDTLEPLVPHGNLIFRKFGLGPFEVWPVEARFSGPAVADPVTLRRLAAEAKAIIEASPHADFVRTDWRQPTQKLVIDYDERNARWTSIDRVDVAQATLRAYDGGTVGQFREQDKLMPIKVRHVESERQDVTTNLPFLMVRSPLYPESVPLQQVTHSIAVEWENPLIWRFNRRRTITVGGVPTKLASALLADVKADIEAIELPPGYGLMWDGEYRSSGDAQASLIPGMIPALVIIALICVALFNSFIPALIIAFTVPFVMIGVTWGLLITRNDFGFVAMLGAMSLAGMMIKSIIVLLDQANIELEGGKDRYTAIVDAAISRLRPVVLAAATTVLGVIPLLPDVFWESLAISVMFGLSIGTLLTMIGVPVYYAIFYRLPRKPPE